MPATLLSATLRLALLIVPAACAQRAPQQAGDDLLFVPRGLSNTNVNGHDEGLVLLAFTLLTGATGPELYAAVRNDTDGPLCQPGMTTEFYDKDGQHLTSAGSIVQTDRFYRWSDGTIIPCVDPGQTAMAAATGLPDTLLIDELGHLEHLFPAFILQDIVAVPGLSVDDVQSNGAGAGGTYSGVLANGFEVAVRNATVTVFPVNRVGRPLGMARARSTNDIPAGGRWHFETSSVDDLGAGDVAFPSAMLAE